VFETGQELAAESLQRWVADALAYYKVPSVWETRTTPLPRNATGKVLKNALRSAQDSMFIEE
jgi:acyl-CoA synthetase (AMP-forming)/AMP-acid ligase II